MSEEQNNHLINDAPIDERKAKLEAAYEQQKDTDAPYKDVVITTLDEVQWIMAQRHWSGEYDLPEGMQRANLSGADLSSSFNLIQESVYPV